MKIIILLVISKGYNFRPFVRRMADGAQYEWFWNLLYLSVLNFKLLLVYGIAL